MSEGKPRNTHEVGQADSGGLEHREASAASTNLVQGVDAKKEDFARVGRDFRPGYCLGVEIGVQTVLRNEMELRQRRLPSRNDKDIRYIR